MDMHETYNHSTLIDIYICRCEPDMHDIDHYVERFLDTYSSKRFPKRIDAQVWDFLMATKREWLVSSATTVNQWLKTKAENIGRHIAIRVHYPYPKETEYRVFSPEVDFDN